MNNKLTISDSYNEIIKKIHTVLEIKETTGVADCLEIAGDCSKVLNFLRASNNLICQKRFEAFLNKFSIEEKPTEEQISKLLDYINDEKKAEFVASIFSKILLSKSNKACAIMGYIMKKIVDDKEEIEYIHLVCIEALANFFDDDITNFKFICNYMEHIGKKYVVINKKLYDELDKKNLNRKSIVLTIEKSVTYQLLFREFDLAADVQNEDYNDNSVDFDEYFTVSDVGKLIYYYINQLNF